MGRIDEALRRSASTGSDLKPVDDVKEAMFVSAWTFGGIEPESVAVPDTADLREESSHGLHVVWPSLLGRFRPEWRDRLALSGDGEPGLAEQFRRLAATLLHSQRADGIKSVMITS